MPIRAFLEGRKFDPETIRMLGIGFEMALAALRLADKDIANEVVRVKLLHLRKRASAIPNDCAKACCGNCRCLRFAWPAPP